MQIRADTSRMPYEREEKAEGARAFFSGFEPSWSVAQDKILACSARAVSTRKHRDLDILSLYLFAPRDESLLVINYIPLFCFNRYRMSALKNYHIELNHFILAFGQPMQETDSYLIQYE